MFKEISHLGDLYNATITIAFLQHNELRIMVCNNCNSNQKSTIIFSDCSERFILDCIEGLCRRVTNNDKKRETESEE